MHNTQIAAVDVPLKMSQWMQENECALAGQMSPNTPMKMVFVGRIVDALFIFRYKLPPSVIIGYYAHITTISMCGPRWEGAYRGFIIRLKTERRERLLNAVLHTCFCWCWHWGQCLVSGRTGCCSWAGVNFSAPSD